MVDDLTLIIGEAEREFCGFAHGGTIEHGTSWKQELQWIWQAVVAGGFTQQHYLDAHGSVIGWTAKFLVNSHELIFRNGCAAERLFARKRVELVTYEPYF